ncbi:hypothetical protein LPJ77_000233 [Coemansia sp. RSA 2523]|nr:hypothetical protein LPJ77_000233 [Coemansia sp. RSA 2523]KAJ2250919.1 hypothetical protein GGH97_000370 [Coemansia sp. RSA 475]
MSRPYLVSELANTSASRQSSDDQHPMPPYSGEDDQSSSETPSRPKRAQVKNACINCQKACKKCDSGRPCERCIKYNLVATCIDSTRKPRKRGVKRGPYRKRKREVDDELIRPPAPVVANQPAHVGGEPGTTPLTSESSTNIPSTYTQSALSRNTGLHRSTSGIQRRRRQSRTLGERAQRPPRILGPGAIPILHTDPAQDDSEYSEESSSDVPLVIQHANAGHVSTFAQSRHGMPPETPTAGLSTAFSSLGTSHHHQPPMAEHRPLHHGAISPGTTQYSHHRPMSYLPSTGSIRLPPIESFDQAQALGSPPHTSSLSILTDVALGRTATRPPPSAAHPQPPPLIHPPVMHPPLPQPPSQQHNANPDDIGQQSQLQPPEDPHSRYTTSTGESDVSANNASSFDSRQSPESTSRAYIRRLSHRLHHTHIEQEPADT